MPNWLGDCIMAMPAVCRLMEAMPDEEVYLAARTAFGGVLAAQPGVAGFVPAPESGIWNMARSLARPAKGGAFDMGLLLPNSFSSALWLWRMRARMRIGYQTDGRRCLLTHPVPCGPIENQMHFNAYYLWLVHRALHVLGVTRQPPDYDVVQGEENTVPRLAASPAGVLAAESLRSRLGIVGPYAVLAPVSAYGPVKDWPADYYRVLAQHVVQRYGMPVLVTAGAKQTAAAQAIADGLEHVHSVAGQTGLESFLALLRDAALFVGGDSGGAHAASAFGIPTVVIFGITNPIRTRPNGLRTVRIGAGMDKDIPLDTPQAREMARQALSSITPDRVQDAVCGLLEP